MCCGNEAGRRRGWRRLVTGLFFRLTAPSCCTSCYHRRLHVFTGATGTPDQKRRHWLATGVLVWVDSSATIAVSYRLARGLQNVTGREGVSTYLPLPGRVQPHKRLKGPWGSPLGTFSSLELDPSPNQVIAILACYALHVTTYRPSLARVLARLLASS